MSTAGRVQEIVQGQQQVLRFRFLLAGAPTTPSAATITIYNPGNSALVGPSAATISTHNVTFQDAFAAGIYPYDEHYRAVWTCTSSGTDYLGETYFDVVPHLFDSLLTDDDLEEVHPDLLDLSSYNTFVAQRNAVWADIRDRVRSHIRKPAGYVANPGVFFAAHREGVLAMVLRDHVARNASDLDTDRADHHLAEYQRAMEVAFGQMMLDTNEDKQLSGDTEEWQTRQVRWCR